MPVSSLRHHTKTVLIFGEVKTMATTKIAVCQRCCLCVAWAFWDRISSLFVRSWYDLTSAVIASRKTITDYKSHISLLLYICIYVYVCIHVYMCTSLGIIYSMCVCIYIYIYMYVCIKFRLLYKSNKWKSIIFITSVFSRWQILKWIPQNLWLMKHH